MIATTMPATVISSIKYITYRNAFHGVGLSSPHLFSLAPQFQASVAPLFAGSCEPYDISSIRGAGSKDPDGRYQDIQ